MPHLIAIHISPLDECTHILGICEYMNRKEFDTKVVALCAAMGWSHEEVKYIHCYDNQIINAFENL